MATYERYADGTKPLADIATMISGEEAGASEFTGSTVAMNGATETNRVTFKTLQPGEVPNPLHLVTKGAAPPANAVQIWDGEMIASSKKQGVTAYRDQGAKE